MDRLVETLLEDLARTGPASAREGRARLGISQSSFSRAVARAGERILKMGRGRATRYAVPRVIAGAGARIPIYRVGSGDERARQVAQLRPLQPSGFYLEPAWEEIDAGLYDDLPWFLHDMRPAGFLGRLVPRRHPELEHPLDVRQWTAEHCLRYLTRFGWDLPGDLILGDEAFSLFIANARTPPNLVDRRERKSTYARIAEDVLAAGPAGSSAAGEQPKFIACRGPERQPVLVKFSPPVKDSLSERLADLLVCEHLALQALSGHGQSAAASELVFGQDRVFLEVERFDRLGMTGRRGTVSLTSVDSQFVGRLVRWSDSLRALVELGLAPPESLRTARWLELFGGLIADTDMHPGNLSFFSRGAHLVGLAPAYDRVPMAYAPRHGQIVDHQFHPPMPTPADAEVWEAVRTAANDFWRRVAAHPRISSGFREIASGNASIVDGLADVGGLLPRG